MAKMFKLKKIKKSNYSKKPKKKILYNKKSPFLKKACYQVESPFNNNEFLIANGSTPFFHYNDEEEDDLSNTIVASSLIKFNDDTNSELNPFSIKKIESTNEKSVNINNRTDEEGNKIKKIQIYNVIDIDFSLRKFFRHYKKKKYEFMMETYIGEIAKIFHL